MKKSHSPHDCRVDAYFGRRPARGLRPERFVTARPRLSWRRVLCDLAVASPILVAAFLIGGLL